MFILILKLCSNYLLHQHLEFTVAGFFRLDKSLLISSKKTGKIVTKWIQSSQNSNINVKLNEFSNYLLHQHLEFTACGFFSLDKSLLISISGSITTYMMILIQFQNSVNA